MANKVRGQIGVPFDGGTISLVLSTNSICELEDALDEPIVAILERFDDPQTVRMKTVVALFWALMLDERPDATMSDASRLIDGIRGDHERIMREAVLAAFPDAAEGGDAPEK